MLIRSFPLSLLKLWVVSLLALSSTALAFTPTQQDIEQFKRLPKAQQQQLAAQYGIDINQLSGNRLNAQPKQESEDDAEIEQPQAVIEQPQPTAESKDALQPFGYDLFRASQASFAPRAYTPVPDNYIVGPGDTVFVQLYGKEERDVELEIQRDGTIQIPSVGPVHAAGHTFSELKDYLNQLVEERTIGIKAHISLGKLRSIEVFVLGEAKVPGSYTVSALSTITHAIFTSGGVSDIASLRNIQLKRAGETVATLDLYQLLINGDTRNDLRLRPGDVILIPPVQHRVAIEGKVRRPAIFELKTGENFNDLLEFAGGFLPEAFRKRVLVERFDTDGLKTVYTLDFSGQEAGENSVHSGDHVYVRAASNQYRKTVQLIGAVVRPGNYQWREQMRLSDLVVERKQDLTRATDMDYALVVRTINPRGHIQVLQFSPAELLADQRSADNLALQPDDQVLFFSRYEQKPAYMNQLEQLMGTPEELKERRQALLDNTREENKFWRDYIAAVLQIDPESADFELVLDEKMAELERDKQRSQPRIEQETQFVQNRRAAKNADALQKFQSSQDFSRYRLLLPVIEQLQRQARAGDTLQLIEVSGAVKYPGVYPLPHNGTVHDAVLAAGGLNDSAFLQSAELVRFEVNGNSAATLKKLNVNLRGVFDNDSRHNLALQPKDKILVQGIPEYQADRKVTLAGEVKFPGVYTISRGDTLLDVIHRAGGFTEYAHPEAAIFTREMLKRQEAEYIEKMSDDLRKDLAGMSLRSSEGAGQLVDYEQLQSLLADLTKIKPVGRMVIDMQQLIAGDPKANVRLEDGDLLAIPAFQNTINIVGQVQMPTTVRFDDALKLSDYLERAGGMKRQADDERVYILKADGSVRMPRGGFWFSSRNDLSIQPGDTIVVPLNINYMDAMTVWSNVTRIVYNIGVAVAALTNVIK